MLRPEDLGAHLAERTVVANEHVSMLNAAILELEFEWVLRREILASDRYQRLVWVEARFIGAIEHLLEKGLRVYNGDLRMMSSVFELRPV